MFSHVRLISGVSVDFNTLCSMCKEALDRNIAQGVIPLDGPLAYAKCLAALGHTNTHDLSLLRHIHLSFLVVTDTETYYELLRTNAENLSIVSSQTIRRNVDLSVITASLDQWYYAIIASCTGDESSELRSIFNTIMLELQRIGFSTIFAEWRKEVVRNDNTFKLIENE